MQNKRYLIFLFFAISGFALLTRLFQVKQVTVVGNVLANEGRIRRIIGQPNLLWTDLKKLEKEIREDSFIKEVSISVNGFSAITVLVDELKPVANWDISGALIQVASNGTILTVDESFSAPIIKGLSSFPYYPGKTIPNEYLYFIKLVEATRDLGLLEINVIEYGTTLKLKDSCEVFLGTDLEEPEIIRQKLKEITLRGPKHRYIDLSEKGYARGL